MFRIAFLTDLHIGTTEEFPLGVDLRANLNEVLEKIKNTQPDLIIIGGDFCLKGPVEETLLWIKEKVDALKVPYFIISGNHDAPVTLATSFDCVSLLKGEELYYRKQIHGYEFLFLDTTTREVSESQMIWLSDEIEKSDSESLYVIMHHPPCLGHLPHMDDSHFLLNHKAVMNLLQRFGGRVRVFCGHYHTDRIVEMGNVTTYFTPSLYMQISDQDASFQVETYSAGFRIIELREDSFFTKVKYCEPNRFLRS